MKTWYTITAKKAESGETEAEISIYDEIGYWGVTAKAFIADLRKIDAKKITLSVNSPGGSVFDGFAIYNALKQTRDKGVDITAKVMGIAASAASFIVMAANKIVMPENSMMMVHYASGLAWGNADDMRETADILDKLDSSIVAMYVARSGKSEEEVRAMLEAETYMSAAEAKEAGFADEVIPNVTATASFDIDRLPANVQALFKSNQEPTDDPNPVADQIVAAAKKAGFETLGDFFALNCADMNEASNALAVATEIKALCAVASKPALAERFIKAKKTVADVRADLCNALAEDDLSKPTSSARRNPESPSSPQPVAQIKTADVWAARRKSQQGA